MENIVAARKTEDENPVIKANDQSKIIEIITNKTLPLLFFLKNPSKSDITQNRIPTCSPETAKTCIAPADEKMRFISGSNVRLSPSVRAESISSSVSPMD